MSTRAGAVAKRTIDIVASAGGLVVLAPVLAVVAVVVRLGLGSPVLFGQKRPGLGERPFTIWKFRTLSDERDEAGRLLPDEERLTRAGALLRRTSLDELPELFCVLKGEMSLVGPRPLLTRYLPYYSPRERVRFSVRPGITGWAQVNGRNCVGWDERLAMDAWYVEHRSLALDLRILAMTLGKVLGRADVEVTPASAMADLDTERAAGQR